MLRMKRSIPKSNLDRCLTCAEYFICTQEHRICSKLACYMEDASCTIDPELVHENERVACNECQLVLRSKRHNLKHHRNVQ